MILSGVDPAWLSDGGPGGCSLAEALGLERERARAELRTVRGLERGIAAAFDRRVSRSLAEAERASDEDD